MSDVGYVGQNAREREMGELGLIGVVDWSANGLFTALPAGFISDTPKASNESAPLFIPPPPS